MKALLLTISFILFSLGKIYAQVAPPDSSYDTEIFTFVDKQPTFPGGNKAFSQFLATYIRVPKEVKKGEVSGRVVTQFVVNKAGGIEDIEIIKSLSPACDKAVIAALRKAPRFSPAFQNKKPVKFRYTLPVDFNK